MAAKPIDFKVPSGDLNTLLLWWIRVGWARSRSGPGGRRGESIFIFSSKGSRGRPTPKPFTHTTLCDYWERLVRSAPPAVQASGPKGLTITMARTTFIEAATQRCEEEEWSGLATLMGNTVGSWIRYYAPSIKRQKCQTAADGFSSSFHGGSPSSVLVPSSLSPSSVDHPMHSPPSLPSPSSSIVVRDSDIYEGDAVFDGDGHWRGFEELGQW